MAPAADEAFSVEPEARRWVGEAWIVLSQARLDRYGAFIEMLRCKVRLLSLLGVYGGFLQAAWDEGWEPEYVSYASAIEINEFEAGWLLGYEQAQGCQEADGVIDSEEAIRLLANSARPTVVKALLSGFGDEGHLFASLWRTRSSWEEAQGDNEDEIYDLIVNDFDFRNWTPSCGLTRDASPEDKAQARRAPSSPLPLLNLLAHQ